MILLNIVTEWCSLINLKIKWVEEDEKIHTSYPDFFVIDDDGKKFFIEIKSDFTRRSHNYKIMKAKDAILSIGFNYILLTYRPRKGLIVENFILPNKPLTFDYFKEFSF